ncbi:hypothetical protein MBLNU230_g8225t1 [Neophaeotheca triangularis]
MVNRGRSTGCLTCKQRHVKCDEAKPECRSCIRLSLRCRGYCRPTKKANLVFKDETRKFFASKPIPTSSRSPRSSFAQHIKAPKCPKQPSVPDDAVAFYLHHYANIGREMASTRGFFELLIPAYQSQPQDSPLSLAVSTLSEEVLSVWRQDATSFRTIRQSYSHAISRLRAATQDPVERRKPATTLAVLVLQTYENASAVYDLRWASSIHHNGAASLLSSVDSDDTDANVRSYLRKFMLHTEVSSALRQRKPLKQVAYSWIGGGDVMQVPDNPSSALDNIGASVADLQANYAQFVTQSRSVTVSESTLEQWRTESKRLHTMLLTWAESLPTHWRPLRLESSQDFDPSIPSFQSTCEVYPSCQIASVWNFWQFQRLITVNIILGSFSDFASVGLVGDPFDMVNWQSTYQDIIDSICYSIPFYLGNRIKRTSLSDFTRLELLLPSDRHDIDTEMSQDDYRRHVIAQGPWRAIHPLSHLLTLFSEDHSETIASLPRPGQREWIRDQFLRVAEILHLPLTSDYDVKLSKSSADVTAGLLAKNIRKGAVLMSGS